MWTDLYMARANHIYRNIQCTCARILCFRAISILVCLFTHSSVAALHVYSCLDFSGHLIHSTGAIFFLFDLHISYSQQPSEYVFLNTCSLIGS